jgi:hypothetical protein
VPSIAEVAELIAAGGVGSLLTQFVSRSGERRTLRAKVREELSSMEELRWAVEASEAETETRRAELHAARRRFHSAAMIAHLPKELVELYDHLAMAAFASSKESVEHGDELAGVPVAVSECVYAAKELICDLLWHPVLARLTYRSRFKKLMQLVEKTKQTDAGRNLRWEYGKP